MKYNLLLFLFTISSISFCQDYLMQNGSISTCSGTFYDSGGASSNYSNNENFVFTICPEEVGQRTILEFSEFDIELNPNTEILTFYDGDSTSEPIIGDFTGGSPLTTIFATLDNTSGCITVSFTSDSAGNSIGWEAAISCITPCQDITAVLDSTLPVANSEGIIEVCVGDIISFSGSGVFETDGTGASYTWDLGDGTTASGQNVNVFYDTPGVYLVNLDIRDTNTYTNSEGCPNSNSINQVVRVSGEPEFSGTEAEDTTLCFGDSTTIEGVVSPLTLTYNCPPPESEQTFLPDGSGAVYATCINVTCFEPTAVLTDVSQILDICLNMEHSYSGDLDIFITSPSGQEVRLFDQAGGGTYFGGANDDGTFTPGEGEDYCFSMNASTLLENASTEMNGTPPNNSWIPGTYLPFESFDALLGSPLNGEWCLTIVDNLFVDNGYIFSWELNFDPSVPQEDFEYIPLITSESWDADPTITGINGNIITVLPDSSGEHCYTFRAIDEFGCEYTEEVCVNVIAPGQPPNTFYEDLDGDGYGDPNSTIQDCSDIPPLGYVINGLDCNDTNATINPDGYDEEGNGVDENCDGVDGDALSIDDIGLNNFILSPNPFTDSIAIKLPTDFNGKDLNISVYDLSGRLVFNKIFNSIGEEVSIDLPNDLEASQYFLKISDGNTLQLVKKIIKK